MLGLSVGACLQNLKFLSLDILELLAFNAQTFTRSRASGPEGVALVASGVPNQVQAGTGDVHHPHTSVPRLLDRFCTPLQQQ